MRTLFLVLVLGISASAFADSKMIASLWTRTPDAPLDQPSREVTCTLTAEGVTLRSEMKNTPTPVPAETLQRDYLDPKSPEVIQDAFNGTDEELVVEEVRPQGFERVMMTFRGQMDFLLLEKLMGTTAMIRKGPKADLARKTLVKECAL